MLRLPLLLCLLLIGAEASADRVYLEPTAFLEQAFAGAPPPPQVLWLTADLKPAVREILGHDLPALRLRYWRREGRSAWIFDEIGKERPITVGVVVADGAIERIRVLVFRESRGDEVRHAFFTDQFGGAQNRHSGSSGSVR